MTQGQSDNLEGTGVILKASGINLEVAGKERAMLWMQPDGVLSLVLHDTDGRPREALAAHRIAQIATGGP